MNLDQITAAGRVLTALTIASGDRMLWRDVSAADDVAEKTMELSELITKFATLFQGLDPELTAIAGLTSAANKLPYFTGSGTAALADLTSAGRALLDDADAAAQRTTLGLGTMAVQGAGTVAITGGAIDSATIGATTPVQAQARRPINAQTGTSYTLVAGDAGRCVTLANAAPITLTVPANGDVAFPVDTEIDLIQLGDGVVSIAGGDGVSINSLADLVDLAGKYAAATLKKIGTDSWVLIGGLA